MNCFINCVLISLIPPSLRLRPHPKNSLGIFGDPEGSQWFPPLFYPLKIAYAILSPQRGEQVAKGDAFPFHFTVWLFLTLFENYFIIFKSPLTVVGGVRGGVRFFSGVLLSRLIRLFLIYRSKYEKNIISFSFNVHCVKCFCL